MAPSPPSAVAMLPLWQRIALLLRERLSRLAEGAPVPGEHELAAEYGAARMTVRRALAVLEGEGWLRREPGRGSFAARPLGNSAGLMADLREIGASEVRVLGHGPGRLPVHAAAALGEAEGAACLTIERLRLEGGAAFSHVTTFLPSGLVRSLPLGRLARGVPVLTLLARRGLVLHRAEQYLGAEAAGPAVAAAMGIALGTALVRLDRTAFAADGRAFEYSRSLYRADRFAYRVALDAGGVAAAPRWQRLVQPVQDGRMTA